MKLQWTTTIMLNRKHQLRTVSSVWRCLRGSSARLSFVWDETLWISSYLHHRWLPTIDHQGSTPDNLATASTWMRRHPANVTHNTAFCIKITPVTLSRLTGFAGQWICIGLSANHSRLSSLLHACPMLQQGCLNNKLPVPRSWPCRPSSGTEQTNTHRLKVWRDCL